jgi:phosphate transport system substrate-binding protein
MKTRTLLLSLTLTASLFAGCFGGPLQERSPNPFPIPDQTVALTGSGATFPKPLLETWGIEFAQRYPTVKVSYAGGGSGKGITDVTAKSVLFAGSDAPMSAAERMNVANLLHIPETLGLIAIVYNIDGVATGLKLDGPTLGRIYLGEITMWNHPDITAQNPGIALPGSPIAVVYRSDSSGTTFVFTDWLRKTSPEWIEAMGSSPSKKPDWTKSRATQLSGNGNDGVGTTVDTTPNSIGYVELAYVRTLGLTTASIKSHDGAYMAPSTQGAQKAAEAAAMSLPAPLGDWSEVSITDAPGDGSYPISSFSYILVYRGVADYGGKFSQAEFDAFHAWLWWGLHDGQSRAEPLGYAPLPAAVVAMGEDALKEMG